MSILSNFRGLSGLVCFCVASFLLLPGLALRAQPLEGETAPTAASPEADTPRIEVEPADLDLGDLPEGAVAEFVYTIRNTGQAPLEISNIKATCGCTDVEMKKTLLAPGEASELKGAFDSFHRLGRQVKTINFKTNDPRHKSMALKFKAFVYQEIVVEPTYLMMKTVLSQVGAEKRVRIRAWTDPPLEIKTIQVIDENQPVEVKVLSRTVDLREDDAASTGPLTVIELGVTVPKGAPITILNGKIKLETNNKVSPTLWIPFQGRISGDVYAKPTRVHFGAASPGATLTKVVTVSSSSHQPFSLDGVEPGKLGVQMKPLTEGELPVHRIELSITVPDDGNRRFRDEIDLKIKHPTMDGLQLQVTAIARLSRNLDLKGKIEKARQAKKDLKPPEQTGDEKKDGSPTKQK